MYRIPCVQKKPDTSWSNFAHTFEFRLLNMKLEYWANNMISMTYNCFNVCILCNA